MQAHNPEPKQHQSKESFFNFTTTRPVAILMVVLGVCVFGWISYQQLPLNLMPDISYPSLTVRTEYPGTAPEEVETTVSRPIEQVLGIVNDLISISSISKAGQSDVKLEYSWNTDMDQATIEVREKLDQLYLPDEVKRPVILRYDPSLDPIMRLGIYGNVSLFYLRYLAEEELKRILEAVDGVAAVKVKGGLEEEIRVEVDEQKLTLIGIDIQQVKSRLANENVNLAGGNLDEGQTEYLVRTLNEFKTVEEISEVVIGHFNAREIKVKDIGRVLRTNKEREIITRVNEKESVEIEIYKEADANIVAVAQRVKDKIYGTIEQQNYVKKMRADEAAKDTEKTAKSAKVQPTGEGGLQAKLMTNFIACNLPNGIQIETLSDQSIFIENSVNEVKSTAVIGGILAVLVLLIFLRNFMATMIVGISIPISIVATFAPMKMFGVTLNIMSLGGLALGIGMLVDNSIVVLESISRCREEGDGLIQATIRGVSEVGAAVFSSTLTTVAVFFPIVFVEGVAGQIFGDMALTIVFSLLASLSAALFLIPMLTSRESTKFTAGINLAELNSPQFLDFTAPDSVGNTDPGQFTERFFRGIKQLGQILFFMIYKFLQTLFAFFLVIIKFVGLAIGLPVLPFLALARQLNWLKKDVPTWLRQVAENEDFYQIEYVKSIWPNFLVNQTVPAFYAEIASLGNTIAAAGWTKKIWLSILFPIRFAFYLIKFFVQFILELVFRLFHALLIIVSLIIKGTSALFLLLLKAPTRTVADGFSKGYSKFETGYSRLLNQALKNRGPVLTGSLLLFLFTIFFIAPRLGSELIPEVHQGEFNVDVRLPVGTSVERTDQRILPIQKYLMQQPDVAKVAGVSGTDKTSSKEGEEGEHTAKLTATLVRKGNLVATEERLIQDVRQHTTQYSGLSAKISRPVLFSFKTPIEVEIHGYDLLTLQELTRQVEENMQKIPGLFDVKSNVQRGNPEVQISYNRALLSKYGLSIYDVASILRNKVRGDVATRFKDEDRKIDVLVRLKESDKESISALRRLVVNPNSARPIPLEAVAEINVKEGPAEIRRVEQQRTAVITANISGRDLQSASEDIFQMLSGMDFPPNFTFELAGQNQEMETSLNSLKLALALAIFLVYIVMASQFESLIHPLIILFTIPMALIGVFILLYLLNIPLSIMVFLGIIILAGIVVNNAIVLVDYINLLRERGQDKMAAIGEACRVRLRPIMMTTLTTVLGLLPMALGLGDGAEIRTPMAITVIIGLSTSTLLTLVVIPVMYTLIDRKAETVTK